jgi:hypothetical protein
MLVCPFSVSFLYRGSTDEPNMQRHTETARKRGYKANLVQLGAWNIDITGIISMGFSAPNAEDAPHKLRLGEILGQAQTSIPCILRA